ncbi:T9SS type A sorting domain-containing protein, partial [Cnuella takakiae]
AYAKDARDCIAKLTNITLTAPICTAALSVNQETHTSSAMPDITTLSIKVFPNPSAEQFSMFVESSEDRVVEVIVTDMLGRRLKSIRTAPNSSLIFGRELSPGMYVVEAVQGNKTTTLKILKTE